MIPKSDKNVILHLANDYTGSKVYANLIKSLDLLGVHQIIYTPIRSQKFVHKNKLSFQTENSKIIYSCILNTKDRILFKQKISKILDDTAQKIDFNSIKLTHAHTWFSDGGVAYELYKKYNIPYIVTVRNTDLNLFYKYVFFLRTYGLEILKHAQKIIFISPVYKKRFVEKNEILERLKTVENKLEVINNGIDEFWIKNTAERKKSTNQPIELLYVGNFSPNKNVFRLLQSVDLLNRNGVKYKLKIVGDGGSQINKILKYINNKEYFTYLGKITDKEELKKVFADADIFTMPSKTETFGLVYIEALSQGIPVLFTKNEGIDGCYENIGEAVYHTQTEEISFAIEKISKQYQSYQFDPSLIVQNHNWMNIAERYLSLYNALCK